MRYYKPEKDEIVNGFICEVYNDDTYLWEEAVITDPRAARALWHNEDLRVRYLCTEDFNLLGLNISFKSLGGASFLIEIVKDEEGKDKEIWEEREVFSEEEASIIHPGEGEIGFFYPYAIGGDNHNVILHGIKYQLRNRFELQNIINQKQKTCTTK